MGLHLIGYWWLTPQFFLYVLEVIVGLGMVIFVHELGHFVVAKLCGVKCEKFYLGFDIAGLKLWKFKRGETEYGIGILPLGGYVKMLGQEDNPGRLKAELERAKAQAAAGEDAQPAAGNECQSVDVAEAERALYDPRSYLAQSVPERMAIISAGVIMNVVFALLMAIAAYGLGVFQLDCGIGGVSPGSPAWKANLDQHVGARIRTIGGKPVDRFNDLRMTVAVGDIDSGVPMELELPDSDKPLEVNLHPDRTGLVPTIGITPPLVTKLNKVLPAFPATAADKAEPKFKGSDKVVEIDGHPVRQYVDIYHQLALYPGKTLEVTIERTADPKEGQKDEPPQTQRVKIKVPPQPTCDLGLLMPMGPITAVQDDSPAAKAGLQRGDVVQEVNGRPIGKFQKGAGEQLDAMRLPDGLRKLAQRAPEVTLTVLRSGKTAPEKIHATLRQADWYEMPISKTSPLSAPALGIAYEVPLSIADVLPGSPADQGKLTGSDVIKRAKLSPPTAEKLKELGYDNAVADWNLSEVEFDFDESKRFSWPACFASMQQMPPTTSVELELEDGGKVTLEPRGAADWFNPDRGFVFEAQGRTVVAHSIGEAIRFGARETGEALGLVYRFLSKIGSQVSFKAVGGPVSIAQMAYRSAAQGPAELLLFLTMISANLAVLNFLPIPVLDGGHMVFLLYEGITGKPPNERVQLILSYIGLFLILALMVWAFGLDLKLIRR